MTTKNAGKFAISMKDYGQDGPISAHEGHSSASPASGKGIIRPERQSEETGKRSTRRVRIDDLLNRKIVYHERFEHFVWVDN